MTSQSGKGQQNYRAPRGTQDVLPGDQHYWEFIRECAAILCREYGYQRIDTPVFEDLGLFVRGVGEGTDIVEKEMYTFEDRGGGTMALRPELTAPVMRAYLEHGMTSLPQRVKLYYFGKVFRYERPQAGRYRQFNQFGIEAVGESDPVLDAEVVEMAWRLCQSLGITGLELKLNSIGDRECRPAFLEALKAYYAPLADAVCRDCQVRLVKNTLRLLDCKQPQCQPIIAGAPKMTEYLCEACREHWQGFLQYINELDVPYHLEPRLVRGLDYYTRTVFEIQPADGGQQSTIAAGGRYDGLIETLGGRPTPGIGFATGFERLVQALKSGEVTVPPSPAPEVFVAYQVTEAGALAEAKHLAVRLVGELRRAGVSAAMAYGDRSLRAQLRLANTLGASQTWTIGEEELKAGTVQMRVMASGAVEQLPVADAVKLQAQRPPSP